MNDIKKLKKGLERDAAEVEDRIVSLLSEFDKRFSSKVPYLAAEVRRTGIDLANIQLKELYFRAKHIRARYFLAAETRKVDKSKYQRLLADLEEKVGTIENLMRKGELYK